VRVCACRNSRNSPRVERRRARAHALALVSLAGLATLGLAASADAGFAYRKQITIDGAQVVGGPHVDFPVLFAVEDPDLATVANGGGVQSDSGYDIEFRAADGTTVLDWEIEWYNPATGRLSAWVRFPGTAGSPDTRIENGVDTVFYVYYGDPTIGCCQTTHGQVWDADYRFVLHLGEFTGNPVDATSNGVGTQVDPGGEGVVIYRGEMASPTGSVAWDLATDEHPPPWTPPATFQPDTDTYLRVVDGTIPANSAFTIEAWFYMDTLDPGFVGIVTKNRDSGVDWIGLFKSGAPDHFLNLGWQCCAPNRPSNLDGPSLSAGQWYHAVATYDGATTTRRLFLYGTQVATDTVGAQYTDLALPTRVGDDSNGSYIDGRVDEIRISNVARSPSWIETTARNQACASSSLPWACATLGLPITTPFLSTAPEEPLSSTVTTSDCCRVEASTAGTKLTVTTSDVEMVWDTAFGAGLAELYSEEEANATTNRRGDSARYNVATSQIHDGSWHFERDGPGTLQVVEATPARVRLRQLYDFTGQIHQDRTWTVYSYPRLAVEDSEIFDVGFNMRRAGGLHPKGEATCANQTPGSTFYCAGRADSANRVWLVTDDDNTYGDMLMLGEYDLCSGRGAAGCIYEDGPEAGTPGTYFARIHESTPAFISAGTYTNRFLLYPRLEGLTSTGTEWQPYANDHRNPDAVSPVTGGTGWFDADELTSSPSDFYNEREAAYLFQMSAAGGDLSFDLDGASPNRLRPFFKIRNWRSLAAAGPVTLEAANLRPGVEYTAAVKPFSRSYSCSDAACSTSTSLANGGLNGSTEFLADPLAPQNFTLDFSGTNHLYFGSDSRFHGLNVILATAGAGAGLDLQWEYWNGGTWADLEATAGFTDGTAHFTSNGTISWDVDPAGWTKRTVVAGDSLPLFWVRASLAAGGYVTSPVEAVIKTDILLFQYCGDITADFQTFTFYAPPPTAVELLSFDASPGDAAVDLTWRTGSELRNLGFHLYRSLSQGGPWTRITPSLIPGLGSSPEGASYSFRDTGLVNGVRYFYRLEDIDSKSGSTFHGPVSAVPGTAPPAEDEDSGGSDSDESEDTSSGTDSGGGSAPKTYEHPEEASFRVVSRTKRGVVVELRTPGFHATPSPEGLHISVPGFDQPSDAHAPDLPLKRVVLDGVVGRHARIVWVKQRQTRTFPGLTPAAVGAAEIVSSPDGTVRPGRRTAALKGEGLLPPYAAWIPGDAFIGETKKLALEMNPIRYDASSDTLLLAQTLRVKIAFDRKAARKESGRGSRGRRRPRSVEDSAPRVLAHLHTLTKGLHAVSFESLFPPAHEALPLDSLRLSLQGENVAFHLEPDRKTFGPGGVLFFFASTEARSTDYSSEVAYALEQAPGGLTIPSVSSSYGRGRGPAPGSLAERSFEANRFYQAGLVDAPDIWLWDFMVGGMSKSFPLAIEELEPASTLSAHLQVFLQGASEADTDGDHHLSVSLNGTALGETSFDGKSPHVFSASIPASLLREGENTLTVTNLGDTGAYSFVFLDRVKLVYPQTPALRSGRFGGLFTEEGEVVVAGEASWGLDVTDPEAPVWLEALRPAAGGVRFGAEAGHRYVLGSAEGLLSPRVSRPLRSTLRRGTNRADYVLIAPEAFVEVARPLLERRQDQGLRTKAVSLEEIASEFGHGRPSAQSIRDFLAYAYHSWQEPSLRYVLLLGDSSYDPRNFTGFDQGAPLPAMWVKTSYLWTASDPTLAAVNGEDLLPDLAIGRLPAKTLTEARALVEKVLAFEDGARGLSGTAVLVADNPDKAGDFEADVLDIRASFLGGRPTKTLFLRELGGNTRGAILASLDEGASLMSYAGHGGAAVWASENVLNSWDVPSLLAQSRQPLMLTFNCLNGYFLAPNYDSLSEAFLKVEGRGTIGAFSPSGLSLDGPAHRFHRALMAEITSGTHARLGDAVLAAQAAFAEDGVMPELLAVYHLFGDPGMKIR
jgi:hypothetical protein